MLTQQYVCVMCTLCSDNTSVFTRLRSVKNANTQLIWSSVSDLDKFKFIFSNNDLDICKMCILGVNKLQSKSV